MRQCGNGCATAILFENQHELTMWRRSTRHQHQRLWHEGVFVLYKRVVRRGWFCCGKIAHHNSINGNNRKVVSDDLFCLVQTHTMFVFYLYWYLLTLRMCMWVHWWTLLIAIMFVVFVYGGEWIFRKFIGSGCWFVLAASKCKSRCQNKANY